ncbi:MAG TPA: penicillin acylase family protein [Solirubrobacterales bacterium]
MAFAAPVRSRPLTGTAAIAAGAVAGAIASSVAGAWYQLMRRPLPRTTGSLTLDGLDREVEIRRDRWGVPMISARTRHDLWFGQGFCHGQDRLWQLELYRRTAAGRISEIAGAETLPTDRLMRTIGFRRVADREEHELEPGLRAELEALCAGVNAAAAARPLPFEFQVLRLGFDPWTPADMLAATKLLAFGLSTNWERELLRAEMGRELGPERAALLDPAYPVGHPVATRPGEGFKGPGLELAEQIDRVRETLGLAVEASGSNNWAVSGARSASGAPMLAGDPHLPPSMPGIWYQAGLRLGDRHARGATIPGIPGIYMGHNNDVAWSFTNVMADVEDLYVERIEGERYEHDGRWHPIEEVGEDIVVRGGGQPERLSVRLTRHGPLVTDVLGTDEAEPLALRFAALEMPCVTPAQTSILEPASGAELLAGLAPHTLPASNLLWADRHGGIGYKLIGRIPVRPGGCPDLPKPGWTGEYEWDGYVPYDELPETRDPDRGFLVTANNRIEPEDYPHHISSEYLDGYRARRIEWLITDREEHDAAGFARMQVDDLSLPGLEVAHRLARLRARDQREVSAIERLRSWDGRMSRDSVAASIYQAFTIQLAREFARAAIGDRDLAERWLDRSSTGFTNHVTSPWRWQSRLMDLWEEGDPELVGRSWDELALDSLRSALDYLADRFGADPDRWRWGRVHRMTFPHPLGEANPLFDRIFNRRLETGGAQETVSQIAFDPNDPFSAVWAPSWRMVIDMADPEAARWQAFTGQSGHPGSPHYDDLQPRWMSGETQPMAGEGPWDVLTLEPR